MKTIDISTETKRKEVYELFNSFSKKGDIHNYFGISDNKIGVAYIKNIAKEIGFDLNLYKERKKKHCLVCGKELKHGQTKFCSNSCSAKYNNHQRGEMSEETKEKIKEAWIKKGYVHQQRVVKEKEERFCLNCGKKIENQWAKNFCSNECHGKWQEKKTFEKYIESGFLASKNGKIPGVIRRYLFEKSNYKCEVCGFEGYNIKTGKTVLQIHHINGNSNDNREENLQVLCPNHHAMTENYMGLNRGKSGRTKRYKNGEVPKLVKGSDC